MFLFCDLQVLDRVDPEGRWISHRLYRQHCSSVSGFYTKDLRKLGRKPNSICLIDNNIFSFLLQPQSGVPVRTWKGQEEDTEMLKLTHVLQANPKP